MTALLRSTTNPSVATDPASSTACTFEPGTVVNLEDDGHVVVQCAGAELRAAVASHVPGLIQGQAVLLAVVAAAQPQDRMSDAAGANPAPLVIAAWPMPGAPMSPPWQFDRSTGTLALAANHLELAAVNSVLLNCGDARMQFTRDGVVETRGQSITSAAIETHRIEGGSIELN